MTKKKVYYTSILLLFLSSHLFTSAQENESRSTFSAEILTGYNSGYGIQANIVVKDFAEEFPFKLRLGVGYTISLPGNAADARRIFINNNTNGVPEKRGSAFNYRFDFLLPKSIFGVKNSYLIFGPRYSNFKANFKFIGGNEDFDVKANQWGLGTGIENHFKMTQKIDLVLAFGLDYFFASTLQGHDTSYSPDNENINTRKDNTKENIYFTYKDADKAINQPIFMPRAMIGVSFNL